MQFAHSMERAATVAATALERMKGQGIAPTPDNYAVWYAYVADALPDLTREIDRLIGDGTAFSAEVCESLYNRHFGTTGQRESIDDASRRLERTMSTVATAVGTVERNAADYGRTLADFSGSIKGADGELAQALAAMQEKTRRMSELNVALEKQLNASRKEVDQLRRDLDTLEEEASIDALTGINNRKVFDRILQEAAAKAQAETGFVSLLMIDIDHFKMFNDTHGHLLGDQVLKLVAKSLVDSVREMDVAARYGGEEFAVVMPAASLPTALEVGERIRRTVANRRIVNRRTNQDLGKVTLSIGAAELALGEPLTSFIQRADEALYVAKRSGRNRVVSQTALVESA